VAYYIRVFSETEDDVPVRDLRLALLRENIETQIGIEGGNESQWLEISLQHPDGMAITVVEKNRVSAGTVGEDEIGEFRNELGVAQPRSAADWLLKRLPSVKAIYAFQIFSGVDIGKGWDAIHVLLSEIRERTNGFSQADGEGFSNHQGSHITWEFADDVEGDWQMAVLNDQGEWDTFRMNLENTDHRASFLEGKVPLGVRRI
jgi:hypothetical protein